MKSFGKDKKKMTLSSAGNRTPVSRVTGGDTHHFTTEEVVTHKFKLRYLNINIIKTMETPEILYQINYI